MTRHIALTACLALLALPAAAQDQSGLAGRALAETLFDGMDDSGRGRIDAGQLQTFRSSVFAGMDYDADGSVTFDEFADWDPGFRRVAEELGRGDAFTTALRIVHAFWDRDGDGGLTDAEMQFALSQDMRRADLDDDGFLTREEFLHGFAVIVAMRAAIRPDL